MADANSGELYRPPFFIASLNNYKKYHFKQFLHKEPFN